MERFWHIQASPILEGLSERERARVHAQVTLVRYPKGAFIYTMDDPADRLYLIYHGLVKIIALTREGKEQVLEILGPGVLFGQFFQPEPRRRRTAAQALEEVVVGVLTEADLQALFRAIPALGVRLMEEICRAYCAAIDRMEGLIHARATRRLLSVLVSVASSISPTPPHAGEFFEFPACITQEDLANMCGLNRATASKLINQLRRQGVLGGRGRRLLIHLPRARQLLEEIS